MKYLMLVLMALLTVGTGVGVIMKLNTQNLATIPNIGENTINVAPTNSVIGSNGATDNRCIVTISGSKYDVTQLAFGHSGPRGSSKTDGGFFKCGTDMTTEYVSKHGNNLRLIAPYLISTNNGSTNSVTGGVGQAPGGRWREEDD